MWFFVQLCSSCQDFNWLKASHGPSAIAELLGFFLYIIMRIWGFLFCAIQMCSLLLLLLLLLCYHLWWNKSFLYGKYPTSSVTSSFTSAFISVSKKSSSVRLLFAIIDVDEPAFSVQINQVINQSVNRNVASVEYLDALEQLWLWSLVTCSNRDQFTNI